MVDERTPVTEDKTLRPCTYGDFAILLRSNKAVTPRYRAALAEQGIPSVSQQGGGFFRSTEITSLLALLGVIDQSPSGRAAHRGASLASFRLHAGRAFRHPRPRTETATITPRFVSAQRRMNTAAAFLAELESYREDRAGPFH